MKLSVLIAALFAYTAFTQDIVYDYVIAGAGTAGLVSSKTLALTQHSLIRIAASSSPVRESEHFGNGP